MNRSASLGGATVPPSGPFSVEDHPPALPALPVRRVLYRHRPWLSDGQWVAHESLPRFSRFAQMLPRNGAWARNGLNCQLLPDRPVVALAEEMVLLADAADPFPVEFVDRDAEILEVLGDDGIVHRFDAAVVQSAEHRQDGWDWRLAMTEYGAVLVGFDRKDRVRFALAAARPDEGSER